jgi:hypothetical protein
MVHRCTVPICRAERFEDGRTLLHSLYSRDRRSDAGLEKSAHGCSLAASARCQAVPSSSAVAPMPPVQLAPAQQLLVAKAQVGPQRLAERWCAYTQATTANANLEYTATAQARPFFQNAINSRAMLSSCSPFL